jgi:nucleotide-binding universal stress UspA family protein
MVNYPIVVGVDSSASALLAAEWGAREAVRSGCTIRLVHAYPANALYEPPVTPVGRARGEVAFDAVRQRIAAACYDGLVVATESRQGSPRRVLLHAAKEARMLVVGRQQRGRLAELLLSSTSLACATHAVTPVTVVPRTWDPGAFGKTALVLGVDGSERGDAAAEHAFRLAVRRQWNIVAVLALDQPAGYPQGWPVGDGRAYLRADGAKILDEALAGWRAAYPGVPLELVVDDRSPAEALADYAESADRVIIGGRGHGLVTGALLGSVARDVIRRMPCPVTVVPAGGRS